MVDPPMKQTNTVTDDQWIREFQARNLRLSAEIYRQALKPIRPALLVCGGFVVGAGTMAVLIVGLGWL